MTLYEYCALKGLIPETIVLSNYGEEYVQIQDIFNAGCNSRNEKISKIINDITSEIKSITDGSMKSGQQLIKLRGQKKILKELLTLES